MNKIIVILAFLTCFLVDHYPKDITGTWVVDHVDLGNAPIPAEKRDMALMMVTETFRDVVLNFKADHTCVVTPNRLNLANDSKWEYTPATGIIKITATVNGKPQLFLITAVDKGGKTYFTLPKSTANLLVHKK